MLHRIPIKSAEEIKKMREVCRLTAQILDELNEFIRPGMSTEEINTFVHERILTEGAVPSPLNYRGYPKSVCVSPNDVICHGIPHQFIILKIGDIVNVDMTCYKNGYHGDSSRMYFVGGQDAATQQARDLVRITKEALMAGVAEVAPGKKIGDIGAAIQEHVRSTGKNYGIVRDFTGHGIGKDFYEAPYVPHIGKRGLGETMQSGMIFTIEPMVNQGSHKTVTSKVDGWTVRTADGGLSAQWEHTVLVTPTGVEILTDTPRF